MKLPIKLIEHRNTFTAEYLGSLGDGPIIACDFYAAGAETWGAVPGGYQLHRVVNIDHHAPTEAMCRRISSTNLVMERMRALVAESDDSLVVISHTDCDSVLSSGIISRELDPDPRFDAAAIAADHTGEENAIADLLQPLDKKKDVHFSLRNLRLLLEEGEHALDDEAAAALADRRRKRALAADLVNSGTIRIKDGIAVGTLTEKVDGELFLPLLPEAGAILLFSPRRDVSDKWDVKLWLGRGAPEGASIQRMRMWEFDPCYAGRWNAGANSRNGGTFIAPEEYEAGVLERLPLLTRDDHAENAPREVTGRE